jgi:hypothetical protein
VRGRSRALKASSEIGLRHVAGGGADGALLCNYREVGLRRRTPGSLQRQSVKPAEPHAAM